MIARLFMAGLGRSFHLAQGGCVHRCIASDAINHAMRICPVRTANNEDRLVGFLIHGACAKMPPATELRRGSNPTGKFVHDALTVQCHSWTTENFPSCPSQRSNPRSTSIQLPNMVSTGS